MDLSSLMYASMCSANWHCEGRPLPIVRTHERLADSVSCLGPSFEICGVLCRGTTCGGRAWSWLLRPRTPTRRARSCAWSELSWHTHERSKPL